MSRIKSALKTMLVGGTFLAGAASANAETFRWGFQGDAQTMDPHGLFETLTLGFQRNIYEGLVIRDDKMKLVGALAEKWENIEPNVWRFHLRKGVKFHNGNDFKADDVVFSVNRLSTEGSDMKVVAAADQRSEDRRRLYGRSHHAVKPKSDSAAAA